MDGYFHRLSSIRWTRGSFFEWAVLAHVVRHRLVRNMIDRLLAIKQGRRLLQRPILGLHDKEPQKHKLEGEPANIHEL